MLIKLLKEWLEFQLFSTRVDRIVTERLQLFPEEEWTDVVARCVEIIQKELGCTHDVAEREVIANLTPKMSQESPRYKERIKWMEVEQEKEEGFMRRAVKNPVNQLRV